jgi:hypothetical protein
VDRPDAVTESNATAEPAILPKRHSEIAPQRQATAKGPIGR